VENPPGSIGDFGSALKELPLPQFEGSSDLLGSLGSIKSALPTDLSSVTGDLTSRLGSLGTSLAGINSLLGNALDSVVAVSRLTSLDFRCAPTASAAAGAGGGGAGAGGAGGGGAGGRG